MTARSSDETLTSIRPVADERSLRSQLSPYIFRSMLVGMAAVAVALHRTTRSRTLVWRFAKARARTLEWMLGIEVRMHGLEHLDPAQTYVFAPNHQSHLDILALLAHLPGRTRFAAKRELWRHPVVGAVLDTLGMVPIDREHPENAIAVLSRAAATPESLVVFPEGTRSRDGQLREFKKGAFVLAIRGGLPIVPITTVGTRRLMPRGSRLTVLAGPVDVHVHEPIPTAGLGDADRAALMERVRAAISSEHTGY
jgi:1-acyl-sn-glycerol-3-phosphate acyltransferase